MSLESTKKQAIEYVELCRQALNGDDEAAHAIGDIEDAVEVLCDYIEKLCEKLCDPGGD